MTRSSNQGHFKRFPDHGDLLEKMPISPSFQRNRRTRDCFVIGVLARDAE